MPVSAEADLRSLQTRQPWLCGWQMPDCRIRGSEAFLFLWPGAQTCAYCSQALSPVPDAAPVSGNRWDIWMRTHRSPGRYPYPPRDVFSFSRPPGPSPWKWQKWDMPSHTFRIRYRSSPPPTGYNWWLPRLTGRRDFLAACRASQQHPQPVTDKRRVLSDILPDLHQSRIVGAFQSVHGFFLGDKPGMSAVLCQGASYIAESQAYIPGSINLTGMPRVICLMSAVTGSQANVLCLLHNVAGPLMVQDMQGIFPW